MEKDKTLTPTGAAALVAATKDLGYDGFENVTDDLISLPFLKIAQPNSPELLPDSQLKGLKAGDVFNSVTGEVYGPELKVVLLGFDVSFLEWGESTGQLLGRLTKEELADQVASGDVVKDEFRLYRKATGNQIRETHTFFALLPDRPEAGVVILSFKSTGLKHVRKWLTKARAMRWTLPDGNTTAPAPLYGVVWKLRTVLNKNDQGNWFLFGDAKVMTAERVGTVLDPVYQPLQETLVSAVAFVKDVQFKVNLAGSRDVTDSAPASSEM